MVITNEQRKDSLRLRKLGHPLTWITQFTQLRNIYKFYRTISQK